MAYNKMNEVQFRDAVAASTDADVAEARDYWQRRADAHSAYDYGQRYADICQAELDARADATTAKVDRAHTMPDSVLVDVGQPAVDDTVAKLTRDVLNAGADPRSLTTTVARNLEFDGHVIRVEGKVRR